MNIKEMPMLIASIVIAIVLATAVMVPIISSAIDDQRTVFNNAFGVYAEATDNVSIQFNETGYYVDESPVSTGNFVRLIMSDKFYVERSGNTCYVVTYANNSLNRSTVQSMNVDLVDDSVSISITTSDNTYNFSTDINWFYYANTTGEYRMINVDNSNKHTVYFRELNDIVVLARTTTDLITFYNGEVSYVGSSTDEVGVEYDIQTVSGVEGVHSLYFSPTTSESQFNFVMGDSLVNVSSVLAPYEVVGDNEPYGGTIITLLSILPVLVVLGVVIAIPSLFRRT